MSTGANITFSLENPPKRGNPQKWESISSEHAKDMFLQNLEAQIRMASPQTHAKVTEKWKGEQFKRDPVPQAHDVGIYIFLSKGASDWF